MDSFFPPQWNVLSVQICTQTNENWNAWFYCARLDQCRRPVWKRPVLWQHLGMTLWGALLTDVSLGFWISDKMWRRWKQSTRAGGVSGDTTEVASHTSTLLEWQCGFCHHHVWQERIWSVVANDSEIPTTIERRCFFPSNWCNGLSSETIWIHHQGGVWETNIENQTSQMDQCHAEIVPWLWSIVLQQWFMRNSNTLKK